MGLEVQNCCFCVELELGAKIIAIVEIVFGTLLLIGGGASIGGDPLLGSYSLFQGILALIAGVFLLLGVLKQKASYLLPFLGICAFAIFSNGLKIVTDIYNASSGSAKQDGSKLAGSIIGEILGIAFIFYFFVVIYTLYKKLKGTSSNNAGVA